MASSTVYGYGQSAMRGELRKTAKHYDVVADYLNDTIHVRSQVKRYNQIKGKECLYKLYIANMAHIYGPILYGSALAYRRKR